MDSLQEMLAERACEQLSLAFAYHLDFGNFDALAKLFAPEATLQIGRSVYRDAQEIRQGVRHRYSDQVTRHVCSNIVVDVIDELRAVGVTYVTLYRHRHDGREPVEEIAMRGPSYVGHFEDEFVVQHGLWRFASRRLYLRFRRSRETERVSAR